MRQERERHVQAWLTVVRKHHDWGKRLARYVASRSKSSYGLRASLLEKARVL
jgi:hypothetical protein